MSRTWLRLLEIWGYSSVLLIILGNAVAQFTFRQMAWRLHPRGTWRKAGINTFWITRAKEKETLKAFRQAEPTSGLVTLNRVAGFSTISGLVSTVAWVITVCGLIVHLKVHTRL